MGAETFSVFCLSLLALTGLGTSQLTITPDQPIMIKPPPSTPPNTIVLMQCTIETSNMSEVETRWMLPGGEIIPDIPDMGRLRVDLGLAVLPNNDTIVTSLLLIQMLSYQDSGNYECEVRNTSLQENPWISAPMPIELQLRVSLQAGTNVTVNDTEGEVELSCEMTLYIREDEDLQWFRDGQMIENSGRHTVTYRNGTPSAAQRGGDATIPGRVAVLTISKPVEEDSNTYTCLIAGTNESREVQLSVLPVKGRPSTPSTVQPTITPIARGSDDDSEFPLPAVIGAIAGVLGLIVIILIAVILFVSLRKRTSKAELLDENGVYDSGYSNGGGVPKYAKVTKSVSPPPPLPIRHQTGSLDSELELPGYDVPDIVVKDRKVSPTKPPPFYEDSDLSTKIDPYYDNPEDVKASRIISPKKPAPKAYYDEVEMFQDREIEMMKLNSGGYDMRSVPSPAVIMSGSLQRQLEQKNPDFAYPNYQDGFNPEDFPAEQDYDQIYNEVLDPTMLNHEYELDEGTGEGVPYSAIYEDPNSLKTLVMPLQVHKENIIEVRKLGTGQFGHVILAKTRGLSLKDMRLSETDTDRNKSILVAIKTLKPDAETGLMEAFDKEVKFMSRLNHDNVVRLLGVCTGTTDSFIMMEYMENGDLNQFLQKQKLMPDTITGLQENEVTPIILLYIGVQIASGMHYLATRRFVHRDLATRNCLVGKDFIVKISDFGMSRSLYESAYYRVQGTLVLPIRWMACETFYGKFSVKSDAWAFGVTLWELYTLGKTDPYDYMTDEEVIADSIRGPDRKILEMPEACTQDVYEIMLRCWVHEPSMRADFGEIYSRLFMIYSRHAL